MQSAIMSVKLLLQLMLLQALTNDDNDDNDDDMMKYACPSSRGHRRTVPQMVVATLSPLLATVSPIIMNKNCVVGLQYAPGQMRYSYARTSRHAYVQCIKSFCGHPGLSLIHI